MKQQDFINKSLPERWKQRRIIPEINRMYDQHSHGEFYGQ